MTRASLAALILAAGGGAVAVNGQTLGESTVTATISQTFEFDDNYSLQEDPDPAAYSDTRFGLDYLRETSTQQLSLFGDLGLRLLWQDGEDFEVTYADPAIVGGTLQPGLGRWRLRRLCELPLPPPRRGADPAGRFRVRSRSAPTTSPISTATRTGSAPASISRCAPIRRAPTTSASTRPTWTTRTSTRIRPTARCRATRSPARRSGRCA